jgi:transposase
MRPCWRSWWPREAAVAEATRLRNQLHQLSAVELQGWPDLTDPEAVASLSTDEAPSSDPVLQARAMAVRHLATRLALALRQAAELAQTVATQAHATVQPLEQICGVAALTAGMLAAHLGGRRFGSDAQLAMSAGVAPLDASSGAQERHRLNRGGNRPRNAILHRIALTQQRCHPPAQRYLAKKRAEGKTKDEALRCLKRYIARAVYRAWDRCALAPPATPLT